MHIIALSVCAAVLAFVICTEILEPVLAPASR